MAKMVKELIPRIYCPNCGYEPAREAEGEECPACTTEGKVWDAETREER